MTEPVALAVTVACASLLSSVVALSRQITIFVIDVRAARKDLDAVSRELSSLALCLEVLRHDSSKINFPTRLQQNMVGILGNCDNVAKEMQDLLRKLSSGSLTRRMQWSLLDRDEMNKLRSRLEAHKSTIDIALDIVSMYATSFFIYFRSSSSARLMGGCKIFRNQLTSASFFITSVKEVAQTIKNDTTKIKQDAPRITGLVQEIGLLRLQISRLEDCGGSGGVLLQRFLARSMTYAESVVNTGDLDAVDFRRDPASTILKEDDTSAWKPTRTSNNLSESVRSAKGDEHTTSDRREDRDQPAPETALYEGAPGELEDDRSRRVQFVELPKEKEQESKPKGILKPPRAVPFPGDPNPTREEVTPLKEAAKKGIPPGARWTKINRKLVDPAALEASNERFEARDEYVIVLRVLTREEIKKLAALTAEIRGKWNIDIKIANTDNDAEARERK